MKNKNNKSGKLEAHRLRAELAKFLLRNPDKSYNARQLIKKLDLKNSKHAVEDALARLVEESLIQAVKGEKFQLNSGARIHQKPAKKNFKGYVDMTKSGAGYIVCDELKEDVYVPARYMHGALNKDYVEIQLFQMTNRRRPEGEVTQILQRSAEQFIGTLKQHGKQYYVEPDGFYNDFVIYIKHHDLGDAKSGDKVVVKIMVWPGERRKSAEGKVIDVLGQSGLSDIEMKTILINQGFELEFSDEVMRESAQISEQIDSYEIENRLDLRNILTFTIDPEDAKDFDDAISYKVEDNGMIQIGVHIADVSHYVRPGTALDRDAFRRSTSVYLVDRVLPMLPEKLSNGLCSLRPNEDKLTFSVLVWLDSEYKIVKKWIGRTVIHSDRRFTYEQAQELLEGKEDELGPTLIELDKIASHYRKLRFEAGSIGFESDEVRFKLDEDGTPISVYVKERKAAHMLVEEYMLLANRLTAEYMAKRDEPREVPFIYRVHDLPNMDKLKDLDVFARELGLPKMRLQTPGEIASSLNHLAEEARKDERFKLLEPLAIRTMAKAEYSPENIGHYGLAFEHYTHFTSPIRRYSDVIAHRILFDNLGKEIKRYKKEELSFQCRHISLQERKAMDAERESIKYKQVEYIERHLGQCFEGRISGMIDKGIFVELTANKCEGLIPFSNLSEPYHIEDNRLKAKGLVSGRILKMGDLIEVRVVDTNLEKREIELDLLDD
jgi:ribonuclease R